MAEAELDKTMLKELAEGNYPNRRLAAVEMLHGRFGVSQRRACRIVGQYRSTDRVMQFDNLTEAKVLIRDWRIDYHTNRPHSAHGELIPNELP